MQQVDQFFPTDSWGFTGIDCYGEKHMQLRAEISETWSLLESDALPNLIIFLCFDFEQTPRTNNIEWKVEESQGSIEPTIQQIKADYCQSAGPLHPNARDFRVDDILVQIGNPTKWKSTIRDL